MNPLSQPLPQSSLSPPAAVQSGESSSLAQPKINNVQPPAVSDHYRKCLSDRSVEVGKKPGRNAELRLLRLLNLKDSICSQPSGEDSLLTPALLHLMRHYYKTQTEKVRNAEASASEEQADIEARKLAAAMIDIRSFYSVFSSLGQLVMETLASQQIDTDFLDTPVPVVSRPTPIDSRSSDYQKEVIGDELKKRKWARKHLNDAALSDVTRYQDPVPQRISSLPDARWLETLLTTLTSAAANTNLHMDFSKTPFFIGYVQSPIADQIAKATLFMDHPASGNITHGFISHIFQMVVAAKLIGFSHDHIVRLINHGYWGHAIDPEPNQNYFGSAIFKQGDDTLMLVNHETLMNGRFPDCIQSQLSFGLMSAMLDRALQEVGGAEKMIAALSLPRTDGQSPEECVRQHILYLRALEYALVGAMFELGDNVAKSVAREEKLDINTFEHLVDHDPNHLWGEFLPSDSLTLKMTRAAVCSYLEQPDSYKVYQQVVENNHCWLKPVASPSEFVSQVPYIIYPLGSEPPAGCLQPIPIPM